MGHRSKAVLRGDDITKMEGGMGSFKRPEPDPEWHPACRMIWDACVESKIYQELYQPTDWAVLHFTLGDASKYKEAGRANGQMAATIYSQFSTMLLTEGDRRRAKIEIARDAVVVDEDQAAIDFYAGMAG